MKWILRIATLAAAAAALGTTVQAQEWAATAPAAATPAAPAATAPVAAPAKTNVKYSNKWRIEVSGGANSDGEMVFAVTPKGGTPTNVTVKLDDGQGENNVARAIKNAFEDQIDTRKYDIELDDGEDVLVKKDMTEPVFALELVSSTVKNTRVKLQRE
jgi:hypothetical protein